MLILWKNKKMFSQFSTEIQRKVLPVSVYWLYAKDKPVKSKFTCKMFIFLTQNFIIYLELLSEYYINYYCIVIIIFLQVIFIYVA